MPTGRKPVCGFARWSGAALRWCAGSVKEVRRVNADLRQIVRRAREAAQRNASRPRQPEIGPSDIRRDAARAKQIAAAGARATCDAAIDRRADVFPNNAPHDRRVNDDSPPYMRPERSFQGLILALQRYWADWGCVILQPYDMEVGAGTFHPATTLRALGPKPWNAAYVQPSRRPKDGRYGENPNRLQHYYQMQVILKPSPDDLQELYLKSLYAIGIDPKLHDIRFVEDDWESPTLGAWGLGWECWCDGMEVSQFTYFQQVAGFECAPVAGELTYGLERLAMYVQGVENVFDLNFNGRDGARKVSYGDIFLQAEQEYSRHNFEFADTDMLFEQFRMAEAACKKYLEDGWSAGTADAIAAAI